MGAVYLARDVLLGRKVALKVVHPNLLATAGAVDRFLFEARATASFNHPNIVTIYGLGQVHGCPYVALEYLPGYSLRERLREGPLAVGEVVAMGRRVAEALTEAHRQGLLHCDLKPENVFLPRDGRLRVLDFGLARLVSRAPGVGAPDTSAGDGDAPAAGSGSGQRTGLRGTAAYMAPEQWTQAELTPAVDLWALGVTLFEMLTGERPFSGSLVALYEQVTSEAVPVPSVADRKIGLPGVLADLCARCLRRAPAERPTAADVVDALSRMSGGATRLPASDAECPYRGLQPFRRAHAELFFGRTEETAAFIERLRETALLAVVGPSGAGKSSFIQAGVAPRLETLGPWESLVLRPGAAPFAALASRLLRSPTLATDSAPAFPDGDRRQADAELTLADQLRAEPALLGRQLRQRAAERGTRILVLVDQLEEIFTLTTDAATRRAFADALLFAADDPVGPVKIVLTIRDDFLGRLAEFEALVAEVSRGIVVIRTPGAEALAETLTEPAARVGYRFEDERLVAEMVAEVASEPAGLPLLQFAAERLWEGRDRAARVLRRTTYETIGGVAGALAEHADRVLAGLVGEASGAAREVLLRLVTTEGTRASVKDSELVAQVGPGAAEAIEHLVAARLVVSRRSLAEGHATTELELVHESLITRWERLRRWREESRDEVTLEQDLRDAATQWHRRGQRAEDLWRGLSLAEALDWQGRRRVPLPEDLAQFIERSDREAQHQASRLARLRLGLLGGVLLVALSIGAFLWVRAKEQRTAAAREIAVLAQAEARHQLGQALIEGAQAARLRGDLAEARAKLRASFEVEDSVSARALYAELLKDPLQFRASEPAAVISVAVAPDGKTVATGSYDGTIRLWDWMTGSARVLRGHQKEVFSLAFAPDGRFLLSGSGDGDARLWTLAGSEARVLRSHLERVHAVAVAPDGRTVATATADGLITLIPLSPQGGQEVRTLRGHVGRVTTLEFAPDGRSLASAGDDRAIRIWTLASGEARRLEGHTDGVLVVAFGQHGRQLASASEDQTVRIWDLATGKARVLEGHRGGVTALAFHPRRPWVASGGSDTTVRVWELDTGAERVLPRHRDRVTG
jgi:hypothetical protein